MLTPLCPIRSLSPAVREIILSLESHGLQLGKEYARRKELIGAGSHDIFVDGVYGKTVSGLILLRSLSPYAQHIGVAFLFPTQHLKSMTIDYSTVVFRILINRDLARTITWNLV